MRLIVEWIGAVVERQTQDLRVVVAAWGVCSPGAELVMECSGPL